MAATSLMLQGCRTELESTLFPPKNYCFAQPYFNKNQLLPDFSIYWVIVHNLPKLLGHTPPESHIKSIDHGISTGIAPAKASQTCSIDDSRGMAQLFAIRRFSIPPNEVQTTSLLIPQWLLLFLIGLATCESYLPAMAQDSRSPEGGKQQAASDLEPRKKAIVEVDITRDLSIGGNTELRREAYFNIHATPGEFSDTELEWLVGELRANFGRSMGTISSFIHGLKEDPDRPGFAEPDHLANRANEFAVRLRNQYQRHGGLVKLVNSVHPYSYYGNEQAKDQDSKKFTPGSHEAAAEILSAFYRAAPVDKEPYFEVANECNVRAKELGTTFADMCDLHAKLARQLHKDAPGLQIGGPTAAWPAFEVRDFGIWRDQMGMFIERAAADMDFLSIHLYSTHWDDSIKNRFGANIDAILDLLETQSLMSTGQVKPLLISECGTGLRDGEQIMKEYSPYRDWLILRGANHVLMNLVRRDDRIIKMVPFITAKATWYKADHPYPWVLFHKKEGAWMPTHLAKWYDFWKEVQGKHLPTKCSVLDVQTHAVLDGDTVHLMIDNLKDNSVAVDVRETIPEGNHVSNVEISHLYFNGEEPALDVQQPSDAHWRNLVLKPHEAVIVKLQLESAPIPGETLTESIHYADRTLQPITGNAAYFKVHYTGDTTSLSSAMLRVSFGRNRNLSLQPSVSMNGTKLEVPENERGQRDEMGKERFTAKEIQVPVQLLKKTNRVAVQFPDSGGHVSTVVLVSRESSPAKNPGVASIEAGRADSRHLD